jgi:hypothetical protein
VLRPVGFVRRRRRAGNQRDDAFVGHEVRAEAELDRAAGLAASRRCGVASSVGGRAQQVLGGAFGGVGVQRLGKQPFAGQAPSWARARGSR